MNAAERMESEGPRALSDLELLDVIVGGNRLGPTLMGRLAEESVHELAWATPGALVEKGYPRSIATKLVAVFEMGRRGAWSPPRRGERCLDPARVFELMRSEAHEETESFHVIMLDVRGRLLRKHRVAQGSLSQCPVSPRDTLRPCVAEGAHSVVFVHNHPSGDPSPSADDVDLTERLRAAATLVGILPRDHVIVSAGGYYSFVEAGRWRR